MSAIPENGKEHPESIKNTEEKENLLLSSLEEAVLKVGTLQSESLKRIQELAGEGTPEAQALEALVWSPDRYSQQARFGNLSRVRTMLTDSVLAGKGKIKIKSPEEVVPWGKEGSDKSKEYAKYIAPLLSDDALALYKEYFPLLKELRTLEESGDAEGYTNRFNALDSEERRGFNFATSINAVYAHHQLFRELFGNNEDSLAERKGAKYPAARFWEAFENRAKED